MKFKMKKHLINASNLHVGGGVQVATSFISELLDLEDINLKDITIICSSSVVNNLPKNSLNLIDYNEVFKQSKK